MGRRTVRLATLAVGTAAALALGWLVLRADPDARLGVGPRLVDQRASIDFLLLERQIAPRGLGPFELRPGLATLTREPIDAATARRIFPLTGEVMWDPQQYYRYASDLRDVVPFPEHAGGSYLRRTNSAGYREDHDLPVPRPGLLVLATGDSQTAGLCENAESWPNRLEALLATSRPGPGVEVLNAGVQTFSFYQYLGSIERALPLRPDVVVTLCYGGNDFAEVTVLHHIFQKTVPPPKPPEYWATFSRAKGVHPAELTQILYQAVRFEQCPDEAERGLEAASAVCVEIQRVCAASGAHWIFAYLPSAYCIPWKALAEERARDLAELGLSEASLARIDTLADRLLAILRSRGVTAVDLRPEMRRLALAGERPPYWGEFHLDLRGNELVAGWLRTEVERALAQR